MPAIDSFNASVTNVQMSAPSDVTGLERIMLAAQGDLQRLLSAFFARPIIIERQYAHTSPRTQPASPDAPITQERQVHLQCGARVACIATSRVTITAPECERLFLDERFAIGQLFRQMKRVPAFELVSVHAAPVDGKRELRRRYTLETPGFACDILEVFPDRDMFVLCERWLEGEALPAQADVSEEKAAVAPRPRSKIAFMRSCLVFLFPSLAKALPA